MTDKFAMFAKVIAQPGQREALVEHLQEAARVLTPLPGCRLYVINVSASEPDAIWVYEVWDSDVDHDASLKLESVKALVDRARSLVGGFESMRLRAVGGKGI